MQNTPVTNQLVPVPPSFIRSKLFIYIIVVVIFFLAFFIAYSAYRLYNNKPQKFPEVAGTQACSPDGLCKLYAATIAKEVCPITFTSANCDNKCGDIKNRCSK